MEELAKGVSEFRQGLHPLPIYGEQRFCHRNNYIVLRCI
jgi:hypothetical protein